MAAAAATKPTSGSDKVLARKVKTPIFRISFPQVFQPKAFQGQEPKYSVVMLFPKETDLKTMKQAAAAAATEQWGPRDKWPKNLRMPFRDGSEKADMQGYENCVFVSASSKQRPGIVDGSLQPVNEQDGLFYAGGYGRATLIAFAYDKAGNRGVSFSLQNLQWVKDGEPFSGRRRAEDEFDKIESDDDDDSASAATTEDDDYGL